MTECLPILLAQTLQCCLPCLLHSAFPPDSANTFLRPLLSTSQPPFLLSHYIVPATP